MSTLPTSCHLATSTPPCPCLAPCGGRYVPTICCSLLLFPRRSEFTDTILSVHPSDVLDMPVDPNEPTYCLCHQVSYGEMIGCDNPDVSVRACQGGMAAGGMVGNPEAAASACGMPALSLGWGGSCLSVCLAYPACRVLTVPLPFALQCPIEWFHFACVDLTTKPKGKWSVCVPGPWVLSALLPSRTGPCGWPGGAFLTVAWGTLSVALGTWSPVMAPVLVLGLSWQRDTYAL